MEPKKLIFANNNKWLWENIFESQHAWVSFFKEKRKWEGEEYLYRLEVPPPTSTPLLELNFFTCVSVFFHESA